MHTSTVSFRVRAVLRHITCSNFRKSETFQLLDITLVPILSQLFDVWLVRIFEVLGRLTCSMSQLFEFPISWDVEQVRCIDISVIQKFAQVRYLTCLTKRLFCQTSEWAPFHYVIENNEYFRQNRSLDFNDYRKSRSITISSMTSRNLTRFSVGSLWIARWTRFSKALTRNIFWLILSMIFQ